MPAGRPVQYCRYGLAILPRLALWAPAVLTRRHTRDIDRACHLHYERPCAKSADGPRTTRARSRAVLARAQR